MKKKEHLETTAKNLHIGFVGKHTIEIQRKLTLFKA